MLALVFLTRAQLLLGLNSMFSLSSVRTEMSSPRQSFDEGEKYWTKKGGRWVLESSSSQKQSCESLSSYAIIKGEWHKIGDHWVKAASLEPDDQDDESEEESSSSLTTPQQEYSYRLRASRSDATSDSWRKQKDKRIPASTHSKKDLRVIYAKHPASAVFSKLITSIQDLNLQSIKEEQIAQICNKILDFLGYLMQCTERKLNELHGAEEQTETEFQEQLEAQTEIYKDREMEKEEKSYLQLELARLRSRRALLFHDHQEKEKNVLALENGVKEQERIRFVAAFDWIPPVGVIGGLVSGDYARMIPFYSTIRGITSRVHGTLETAKDFLETENIAKNRLDNQIDYIENLLAEESKRLRKTTNTIRIIEDDYESVKVRIQELSMQLTAIRNVQLELGSIKNKVTLMVEGAQDIQKFGARKRSISALTNRIKEIQPRFMQAMIGELHNEPIS